jgi:hypothetical protein
LPDGVDPMDLPPMKLSVIHCPLHNAAPDFREAITGHEDPGLWRVSWTETLIRRYQQEHDWEHDEDPGATLEAIATCLEMCLNLRAVLKQSAGERQ